MAEKETGFRIRTPNLLDKMLYQKIMTQANWEYPLGKLIAHGGMASVYELNTPEGEPRQVVKVIDTRMIAPDLRRIVREHGMDECRIMSKLSAQSPCIMPLNGYTWTQAPQKHRNKDPREEPGWICLMQMPRAKSLTRALSGKMAEPELIRMAMDICCALQVCYDHDRIHRDVKPDNIFLRKRREGSRYLLGDFGIARVVDNRTLTGIGTEYYLAPELRAGWISRNSDVYSLGVTMFHLAGGAFCSADQSRGLAMGSRLDWEGFVRTAEISQPLLDVIQKALQDQHHRYKQPGDMYQDLWWLQERMQHHAAKSTLDYER